MRAKARNRKAILDAIGWWPLEGMTGDEVMQEWGCFLKALSGVGMAMAHIERFTGISRGAIEPDMRAFKVPVQEKGGNRKAKFYVYANHPRPLSEIAAMEGLKYQTLYNRMNRNGLTVEQAIAMG